MPSPPPSSSSRPGVPRVVIDLEKLRHINCGLGRFSLHLGHEILALADERFEPVLFLPDGAADRFARGRRRTGAAHRGGTGEAR